jgi:very-short-patch-repair endonuclease
MTKNDRAPLFAAYWSMLAPTHYRDIWQPEYVFAAPRRWRFDFAHPATLTAIEVDGGQYLARGGRHNTDGDRDKLNHAASLGWVVFRFSPQQLDADPSRCVQLVLARIEGMGTS